jgi:hypothetical protein
MEKILSIRERLEDKKRKDRMAVLRQKVETVQKTVQCALCRHKCAMCGGNLSETRESCPPASSDLDIHLCKICRAEFEDYLQMTNGKRGSDIFWHNEEWLRLWSSWLEHQQALKDFGKSRAFRELTRKIHT